MLLVGTGGFIGSVLRFVLGSAITGLAGTTAAPGSLPAGTLCVNVLGCLIIGVLGSMGQHGAPWSAGARLFLFTGILGGFTTFSAFGHETFELARSGHPTVALLNAALQLMLGLLAVWAGYRLGALLTPMLIR